MRNLTGSAYFKLFPVVRMNCFWSWCKISLGGEEYSDAEYLCIHEKKAKITETWVLPHTQIRVLLWTHGGTEGMYTTHTQSCSVSHSLTISLSLLPFLLPSFLPLTSGVLAGHSSCVVCVYISRGLLGLGRFYQLTLCKSDQFKILSLIVFQSMNNSLDHESHHLH